MNCFKQEKGERINNIHFYFIKLIYVEQLVKLTYVSQNKIDYKVELEVLTVYMNIIFLSTFFTVFVATLYLEGHTFLVPSPLHHTFGKKPTFSTIITLSLMAAPLTHSPEENFLLRLTSAMVIAPGGGSSLPSVYKQFRCFPLYFLK